MADLIREAMGTTHSSPETAASVPESFKPQDPEGLLAARGGSTDDAVADYLRRLSQYDLLTAEQEVEMAQEIEAGHSRNSSWRTVQRGPVRT